MRVIRFAVVGAALVLCRGALAEPSLVRTNDIEYANVDGRPLTLDLYQVEGARTTPVLIWLHGGAWERGSKTDMPLRNLVERGFAIASIDFSPASAAPFPAQVHEIKAAIRFLRASAERFGYDARRVAILGASSGGHLAALVGTTNSHPELEGALGGHLEASSAVQAIVSYFGASNLTTILDQSTPFGLNVRRPALERLLGALPENATERARLASPVFHVDAADPPLLLLHGDQDPQMPINQSHELHGAYRAHGAAADFIVVHGAAHGGEAFYDAERMKGVADFLAEQLR
jgi:acetyl esterase/lipase